MYQNIYKILTQYLHSFFVMIVSRAIVTSPGEQALPRTAEYSSLLRELTIDLIHMYYKVYVDRPVTSLYLLTLFNMRNI